MRYLCLIYIEADKLDEAPASECLAFAEKLRAIGHCHAAEALRTAQGAITLRMRNGKLDVIDGPFTETKEVLAGFYLLEAEDLDEAIALAAKIPPLHVGRVELRPVLEVKN
jgi:hypothetical protein